MKVADPAAYDQFVDITTGYTSTPFQQPFRALWVTMPGASTVVVSIQQLVNGTLTTAKDLSINIGTGIRGEIIPISGETVLVKINTTSSKIYALI
jgi:hypothetical protein